VIGREDAGRIELTQCAGEHRLRRPARVERGARDELTSLRRVERLGTEGCPVEDLGDIGASLRDKGAVALAARADALETQSLIAARRELRAAALGEGQEDHVDAAVGAARRSHAIRDRLKDLGPMLTEREDLVDEQVAVGAARHRLGKR